MATDPRMPLSHAELAERAGSSWTIEVVERTSSTNADLLARASVQRAPESALESASERAVGMADDHVVRIAEYQSGGRGRLDRAWTSPPSAGLTFSLLLRPVRPTSHWGWLPLIAGLALAEAIGPRASLKWPNDVLVDDRFDAPGRKVAGILAQANGATAVVGVGLNVSTTADELPVPTATSLALAGLPTERGDLLIDFLNRFDDRYGRWSAAAGDAAGSGLAEEYRARCSTIGRRVSVQLASQTWTGVASDVDPDGRLLVQRPGDPGPTAIAAGDLTHLRPESG